MQLAGPAVIPMPGSGGGGALSDSRGGRSTDLPRPRIPSLEIMLLWDASASSERAMTARCVYFARKMQPRTAAAGLPP